MSWPPPDLTLGVTLALVGVSFTTSFITAAFGIGGGAALLAILATLLPPAALIPVHGVVQIGSNLGRAALMRRHVFWSVLPSFAIGSLVGAIMGGSVAVALPPAVVQVGVGLFILWSVFFTPPGIMRRFAWLTGVISSFLTMFFGATGPFVISYVKTLGLDRDGIVGTHATFMVLQHVLKTIVIGILGFAFGPWITFVAAMIAAGFLGTICGRAVLMRIDERRFKLALDAILLVLAARLIWSGFEMLSQRTHIMREGLLGANQ